MNDGHATWPTCPVLIFMLYFFFVYPLSIHPSIHFKFFILFMPIHIISLKQGSICFTILLYTKREGFLESYFFLKVHTPQYLTSHDIFLLRSERQSKIANTVHALIYWLVTSFFLCIHLTSCTRHVDTAEKKKKLIFVVYTISVIDFGFIHATWLVIMTL